MDVEVTSEEQMRERASYPKIFELAKEVSGWGVIHHLLQTFGKTFLSSFRQLKLLARMHFTTEKPLEQSMGSTT